MKLHFNTEELDPKRNPLGKEIKLQKEGNEISSSDGTRNTCFHNIIVLYLLLLQSRKKMILENLNIGRLCL